MMVPRRRRPEPAVGFNTNLDGLWASSYYNNILRDDYFAPGSPFLTHIREAVLPNGIAPPRPGASGGTAPSLTRIRDILNLPFIPSFRGGVAAEPNCERVPPYTMPSGEAQKPTVLDDSNVWDDERKEREVRWKLATIANAFPDCRGPRGIWLWIGPNEVDLNPWRFQQRYDQDGRFTVGGPAQTLFLNRVLAIARWTRNELRSDDDRWWTTTKHPGIIASPTMSGQALKAGSWDGCTVRHFYTHNAGELLGLVDVLTTTWHHSQSTFERGVPGSTNRISAYWIWDAIDAAKQAWVNAGKGTAPTPPLIATEYGVDYEDRIPAQGYYSTAPGTKLLKSYRLGLAACARFFWAESLVTIYTLNASGAVGQRFHEVTAPHPPRQPETAVMREVFDDRKYMLSGPGPWNLPITAKTWRHVDGEEMTTGFHRGYTWAVAAPLYNVPAGDLVSTDPPMPNWLNVTIADNLVTSRPATPAFVQAFLRPAILPSHRTYRVTAEVAVSNGGRIALVARGYNHLDGLVETAATSTSSSWTTVAVTFTTVPHLVPRLPNLPQVCVMLEHNGIGTARFRNVSISPVT